tara:strand:- start:797 stop:1000 length:204 start_codon:yes stop_codon:yes gene_type:complete
MAKIEKTIDMEYDRHGCELYVVIEHGVYARDSVLAGRDRHSAVGFFRTLEQAQEYFPDAEWDERSRW